MTTGAVRAAGAPSDEQRSCLPMTVEQEGHSERDPA